MPFYHLGRSLAIFAIAFYLSIAKENPTAQVNLASGGCNQALCGPGDEGVEAVQEQEIMPESR
jgi:hypothetical protein